MPSPAKLLASASGASVDPNFRNVTLLLHGDGSNGAQNNTFVDSSTNNFTITRNGNTTQGSFSPYGSRWSNYFDGSGDYLTAPSSTAFDLGGGDCTAECWVNFSSTANVPHIFEIGNSSVNRGVVYQTGGYIRLWNGSDRIVSNILISPNVWYHVAVCRVSGTYTLYVNGISQGTYASTIFPNVTSELHVGFQAFSGTAADYLNGYVSDLRIVKGTAVYTSAFTPPTTPLTAISGTSLLTCQSNRFRDASTNNFAITANGNASVSPFSPYAPTAPYSAATNGGSMYFDGNDYLSIANNAAFQFGTGDFTIECWVNKPAAANGAIVDVRSGGTGAIPWAFYIDGSNFPYFYDGTSYTSSVAITNSAWNHVAIVRTSGVLKIFVNGVQGYSAAHTVSLNATGSFLIGGTSAYTTGYISNLRIVKGTAVYTAAFTPPTAPVTAITNTSLLVNGTNAAIIDSSADNDLETVGNAQISTSVKKFGTGSMSFNGSTDWLVTPNKPEHNFGTGDFTIESWVYQTSTPGSQNFVSNYNGPSEGWGIRMVSGVPYFMWGDTVIVNGSSAISANTWTHIAVTRSGTTARLFVNGTQVASATDSTNLTGTGTLFVGRLREATSGFFWNGYLDDLRITKGVARYTANFTPPTAAFPDQ